MRISGSEKSVTPFLGQTKQLSVSKALSQTTTEQDRRTKERRSAFIHAIAEIAIFGFKRLCGARLFARLDLSSKGSVDSNQDHPQIDQTGWLDPIGLLLKRLKKMCWSGLSHAHMIAIFYTINWVILPSWANVCWSIWLMQQCLRSRFTPKRDTPRSPA